MFVLPPILKEGTSFAKVSILWNTFLISHFGTSVSEELAGELHPLAQWAEERKAAAYANNILSTEAARSNYKSFEEALVLRIAHFLL